MNHEPTIKVLKEEIRGMKYFNKNAPSIASLEQSVKELEKLNEQLKTIDK